MLNTPKYACRLALVGAIIFQLNAAAGQLNLNTLRDHMLSHGDVSGEFVQCIRQRNALIAKHGNFYFQPDKILSLNFLEPRVSVVEFLRNAGRISVIIDGSEEKSSRANAFGKLLFSAISLQASTVERQFTAALRGTSDKFELSLAPKKRFSKVVNLVELTGSNGKVNMIRIHTRDERVISLYFFPPDEVISGSICQ